MKISEKYNLIEKKYLEKEQSQAYVFEHKKTKAKVFVMENADDNRLFSIGFRTPPSDSTGVCHIIEHCVLNGSKKYKTKEPFMDMVKSSLQTFLNAMTFSDKTVYPVASRNLKDFENLMDLYLDAVFNPAVLEKKEIFLQEGWRYHLENEKITYKGVVYNEMKGAMSSAEDQIYSQIYKHLYPDTIYSHNSGGDPYEIPNLSYKNFVSYYEKHYHPSNSYIFLYGDIDFEKYLSYIDEEYLSNYEYRDIDTEIRKQAPFKSKIKKIDYFSTDKEIAPNSNMISYSIITASSENSYDRIMNKLIRQVLINSESSPLKEAINKLEIVDDILNASSMTKEITWSIIGKNIKESDAEIFEKTVEKVLDDLVTNGIDQDLIKSMLNVLVFSLKEKNDNPTKGIEYLDRAFDTWLYDLSPIDGIDVEETIDYIRNNIENNIFEKYIQEHLINNPHKLVILHKPSHGLNELKDQEVEEKLNDFYKNLSEEEIKTLKKQKDNMDYFQSKEDSLEDKKTIPILELSDINNTFTPIDRTEIKKDKYTILTHNLPTAGIDYLNFVFDINHIEKEDIPYLSMLSDILGLLSTKNYNYKNLFTKIYLETGGISFNLGSHIVKYSNVFNRTLTVSTQAFSDNIEAGMEILSEIILNTQFDDEKRLKDLINMVISRYEMNLLDYAHILMMNRANSSKFITNNYMEQVNGLDYYLFYKNINTKNLSKVIEKLQDLYKKLFKKNNLVINITSDFSLEKKLFRSLENLTDKLDNLIPERIEYDFNEKNIKEAFITSTDVSFVSIGNNLEPLGYKYQGSATAISNLISNAYLYTEIRAKSGAYGAGMSINNKNAFVTYSYRDPNILKTINTYERIPEFINSLTLNEEDLKPFIIGAVGKFDPPLTEKGKGRRDLEMYLCQIDYTDIEQYIKEAIKTDMTSIEKLQKIIKEAIKSSSLAVLTNENKLKQEKLDFDRIVKLI